MYLNEVIAKKYLKSNFKSTKKTSAALAKNLISSKIIVWLVYELNEEKIMESMRKVINLVMTI